MPGEHVTKCQNIILTLADGRRVIATVPAFCTEEDVITDKVLVRTVQVTEPRELPFDCHWEVDGKVVKDEEA